MATCFKHLDRRGLGHTRFLMSIINTGHPILATPFGHSHGRLFILHEMYIRILLRYSTATHGLSCSVFACRARSLGNNALTSPYLVKLEGRL